MICQGMFAVHEWLLLICSSWWLQNFRAMDGNLLQWGSIPNTLFGQIPSLISKKRVFQVICNLVIWIFFWQTHLAKSEVEKHNLSSCSFGVVTRSCWRCSFPMLIIFEKFNSSRLFLQSSESFPQFYLPSPRVFPRNSSLTVTILTVWLEKMTK